MSLTVTIRPGLTLKKDPNDSRVYVFDWDTEALAVGATIVSNVFTITADSPSTTDTALTKDNESIVGGSRKTQLRLIGGTVGQKYNIASKITTNESPTQIFEKSFFLQIENA